MLQLILAIIGMLLQLFADAPEDSSGEAIDVAVGGGDLDDEGWFTSAWNTFRSSAAQLGSGLASLEVDDQDVAKFALQKEAGVYASIGVGDDGIVQDAASGIGAVLKHPATWVIGFLFLASR